MRGAALLALGALLATGCGSVGAHGSLTRTQMLFAEKCGACHTLAAADTHGTASKNFDELRPTAAAVLRAIATGPGAMPQHLLTGSDAAAVARFVARSSR